MDINAFYNDKIARYNEERNRLKKQALAISLMRLTVFLSMCLSIYLLWGSTRNVLIALVAEVALFLFLVARYTDLKHKISYIQALLDINKRELAALNGQLDSLATGDQYISETHAFNQDIDLFGQGSIFQTINRTETKAGTTTLAGWLNANDIDDIYAKQAAIQELTEKVEWRQHYSATASLIETTTPSTAIVKWLSQYSACVPNVFNWLPRIFSLLSVGMITAYFTGFIPGLILGLWFMLGLFITGPYIKRITQLYNTSNEMKDTFAQYGQLLQAVENESFGAELLRKQQRRIQKEGLKASAILRALSRQIDYLGNRNNMVFAPLANGFFLWDLHYAFRIEQWIKEFDHTIEDWFSTIDYFDAANSFGNFAFNHPDYCYPTLSEQGQIHAVGLGHPLLKETQLVRNDLSMNREDFFIITGANMAGKSTFLRTVAVNLVMANCGLPTCAKSFSYQPIKLISSMRTSDSLTNDESYFFSELKRLKFIVDAIQTDTYFIILDEILKGTNSKDKAEGSRKFVERLVKSNSTGLIATHDLSLCELAEQLPAVQNHYFDAEIVNDELYFDYTFKAGICQNMNASFLLKKMKIVED